MPVGNAILLFLYATMFFTCIKTLARSCGESKTESEMLADAVTAMLRVCDTLPMFIGRFMEPPCDNHSRAAPNLMLSGYAAAHISLEFKSLREVLKIKRVSIWQLSQRGVWKGKEGYIALRFDRSAGARLYCRMMPQMLVTNR